MTTASRPQGDYRDADGVPTFHLSGPLTVAHAGWLETELSALPDAEQLRVDVSKVTAIDTSAAFLLTRFGERGGDVEIVGAPDTTISLLKAVEAALPEIETQPRPTFSLSDDLAKVGEAVTGGIRYGLVLIGYLGLFLAKLMRAVRHPSEFRLTSLVHHCEDVGFKAVPIVALMSFLIGVVLAFQGASQLQQFGAEVFVVDLIAISILRELGILLTSIIVAGRTASAFTAAIGSMKMREEIDAMRTLGLDPAMVLFVPRILALVIMLPILGLIANLMGLFGGALMAWANLGISPAMFSTRLISGTDISHVTVGMIKAPVFALIIGVVGCHAGMQVKSNAESLGRMTSTAVVTAIFAVIVADAAFSIFFARIGM